MTAFNFDTHEPFVRMLSPQQTLPMPPISSSDPSIVLPGYTHSLPFPFNQRFAITVAELMQDQSGAARTWSIHIDHPNIHAPAFYVFWLGLQGYRVVSHDHNTIICYERAIPNHFYPAAREPGCLYLKRTKPRVPHSLTGDTTIDRLFRTATVIQDSAGYHFKTNQLFEHPWSARLTRATTKPGWTAQTAKTGRFALWHPAYMTVIEGQHSYNRPNVRPVLNLHIFRCPQAYEHFLATYLPELVAMGNRSHSRIHSEDWIRDIFEGHDVLPPAMYAALHIARRYFYIAESFVFSIGRRIHDHFQGDIHRGFRLLPDLAQQLAPNHSDTFMVSAIIQACFELDFGILDIHDLIITTAQLEHLNSKHQIHQRDGLIVVTEPPPPIADIDFDPFSNEDELDLNFDEAPLRPLPPSSCTSTPDPIRPTVIDIHGRPIIVAGKPISIISPQLE